MIADGVELEWSLGFEELVALYAREIFLCAVCVLQIIRSLNQDYSRIWESTYHMFLQIRRHWEATLTDRALEWLLSGVWTVMQHKLVPVFKCLRAGSTTEGLVIMCTCEMKPSSCFWGEFGRTSSAFVVCFFSVIFLLVSFIIFLRETDLVAETAFEARFLSHYSSPGVQTLMMLLVFLNNIPELRFSLVIKGCGYI